jgi:hypothetical protein
LVSVNPKLRLVSQGYLITAGAAFVTEGGVFVWAIKWAELAVSIPRIANFV